MPASTALRGGRGERHQLPQSFPRSPGIIPVVFSAGFSGRRTCDCSIKEQGRACGQSAEIKANVLHNFFTAEISE